MGSRFPIIKQQRLLSAFLPYTGKDIWKKCKERLDTALYLCHNYLNWPQLIATSLKALSVG